MECTSFDYLFLGVCSELCQLSVSVTSELLISAFMTCLSLMPTCRVKRTVAGILYNLLIIAAGTQSNWQPENP